MSICSLSRWVIGYIVWCGKANWCLISRDVLFNEVVVINKSDQVTFDTDINANKTQTTKVIDQSAKIEVELSNAHEDKVQPYSTEDDSQDTLVKKDVAPQVIDLQQYQLARNR